jgi:hypothetical protein
LGIDEELQLIYALPLSPAACRTSQVRIKKEKVRWGQWMQNWVLHRSPGSKTLHEQTSYNEESRSVARVRQAGED